MSYPCEQAVNIAKIENTLDHVVVLLEKHEHREGRMLDAIEVVAAQSEAIKGLSETGTRHEKDIDELYHLFRTHTDLREDQTLASKIWTSEVGNFFLGLIILGFYIDVVTNSSIIQFVGSLFK